MNLIKDFIRDLRVELTDEFDRNFERKGFFNEKWEETRLNNRRGSLLMRTGALRRSIRCQSGSNTIRWFSSLPYASIHNDGGVITVTGKMKKYFWAMYLKARGGIVYSVKTRNAVNNQRTKRLSAEAEFFKAMALKKVGSKIKITKRQFIGYHDDINGIVERVFSDTMQRFEKEVLKPVVELPLKRIS